MDIQIVEAGYKPFDIDFVTIDKDYGRAEFTLCIRPTQWWLYTRQQRDARAWHGLRRKGSHQMICSYGDLDEPRVWAAHWCSTHRTMCVSIYVPDGSTRLHVDSTDFSFWS